MQLIPTIICGGEGSRLWPVSRAGDSKFFMHVGSGGSLLQQTFSRAAALPNVSEILTVTNQESYLRAQAEFAAVNAKSLRTPFILEPRGRDTAAAVAIAALQCARTRDENTLMLVMPADHLIDNQQAFADAVALAVSSARQEKLVVFGIEPTSAHMGFGYIDKHSSPIRFVEKPGPEKAEEFFCSGDHLWNSGIFCFQPGTLLREMRQHCPAIVDAATLCLENSSPSQRESSHPIELDDNSFMNVPKYSLDVALMEKSSNIAVVPAQFGWNDIGSWAAVADLAKNDGNGNAGSHLVAFHQSTNCYVHSHNRAIGVVGMNDIIVVDTPEGLLISRRDKTEEVRHIAKLNGAVS